MADFTSGADFISFSTSPPPSPGAGPSRARAASPASATSLNSDDARLLALRAGRKAADDVATAPGKRRKGKKDKGRRGSASAGAGADVGAGDEVAKAGGSGSASGTGNGNGNRNGNGNGNGHGKRPADDAGPAGKRKRTDSKGGKEEIPRSLKDEKKAAERAVPWADDVDWAACTNPAEMLNAEIHAFFRYMSPTRAEFAIRQHTIELISRAIRALWPEAEVAPFGSWQTQLYLPTGDIDLVVLTPRLTEANKNKLLHALAREMRIARITDTVAVIARAKVPIIKFVTLEGRLNVDISMGQANGVSAGRIVNHYLDTLAGARELIMVVKAFLSQRSMNEVFTGGLGSYSVICMVISFMQVHPKVRRGEIDPAANLGTLLIEFFELYGRNFNYDTVGICIRRGGSYYTKQSRGWADAGRQPFLLSIEDPQDADNDISRSSFGIRQVKLTLAGAYDLLQARVFERAAQLARLGHAGALDPDDASVLSGVMGVTKETIKHRRELKALYDSGRLQKRLGLGALIDPDAHLPNGPPRPAAAGAERASSPAPARQGLRGIVVDDDEVDDEVSESDTASEAGGADEYEDDDDPNVDEEFSSSSYDDEDVEEDGSEPGEVRRARAQTDRFASVSSDGDVQFVPDCESRYALGRGRAGRVGGARGSGPARQARPDTRNAESDSSDGAVQVVELPPRRPGARDRRQARDEKRAFWAAKAGAGRVVDDDDDV
ncbi:hypothetical protein Q5752_004223 [Cryptotrichosporon argae]